MHATHGSPRKSASSQSRKLFLPRTDPVSLNGFGLRGSQRTAKDYAYVSANDEHRGPSDPGSYSVSCKHERMATLMRTGLERYNAEMARLAVERERQAKDAALQVSTGRRRLCSRY